jgi:hypothetical protein
VPGTAIPAVKIELGPRFPVTALLDAGCRDLLIDHLERFRVLATSDSLQPASES